MQRYIKGTLQHCRKFTLKSKHTILSVYSKTLENLLQQNYSRRSRIIKKLWGKIFLFKITLLVLPAKHNIQHRRPIRALLFMVQEKHNSSKFMICYCLALVGTEKLNENLARGAICSDHT